jgi:prefoldin subunit 5
MAKEQDTAKEVVQEPINLEEQLKVIEAQIAELRGTHNYINSLLQQGFKVVPPTEAKK